MPDYPTKRREPRFVIAAGAIVKVNRDCRFVRTTTSNISGCGVLLHFEKPVQLTVGDEVSCECNLPPGKTDGSLPFWTVGTVVRVGECSAAVEFRGGIFSPANSEAELQAVLTEPGTKLQ